jgi:hypothetical protein
MKMFKRISRFVRSPEGRRLMNEASRYARSPQGRAKLEQVRRQFTSRRRPRVR